MFAGRHRRDADSRAAQEADARHQVQEGSSRVLGVVSPYSDDGVEARLAKQFREVEVVRLNCLGYDGLVEAAVSRDTGKPVVLARRALAGTVGRAAVAR